MVILVLLVTLAVIIVPAQATTYKWYNGVPITVTSHSIYPGGPHAINAKWIGPGDSIEMYPNHDYPTSAYVWRGKVPSYNWVWNGNLGYAAIAKCKTYTYPNYFDEVGYYINSDTIGYTGTLPAPAYAFYASGNKPAWLNETGANPGIVADFSGTPSSGTVPLTVFFSDLSMGEITNWSWSFGDGGTSFERDPSHTYVFGGTYNVTLTISNAVGNISMVKAEYIAVAEQTPVADFTGTPLSGTAPLTVQFTDLSTGSPTSWEWDFGDGGTSTVQNPSHQFTSAGTYTVSLTAANPVGSDTETKTGYVVVSEQTDFYVYAEGVGMYHGTQADLSLGNQTPGDFHNHITGKCGTYETEKCWYGREIYLDDYTGSVHWSSDEQAGSYADNADFSIFVGHGSNDSILFGTQNSVLELSRSNMRFGSNRAKWVSFFSCNVLNQSSQGNWESVFDGVHIVNGFDTIALLYEGQGTKYAQKLTGIGGGESRKPIRTAWRETLQETINKESIKGAYMWANPCGSDYLPGFGEYCTSFPTKNGGGNYNISWRNFNCSIS
jgi:PKD repeat protein